MELLKDENFREKDNNSDMTNISTYEEDLF